MITISMITLRSDYWWWQGDTDNAVFSWFYLKEEKRLFIFIFKVKEIFFVMNHNWFANKRNIKFQIGRCRVTFSLPILPTDLNDSRRNIVSSTLEIEQITYWKQNDANLYFSDCLRQSYLWLFIRKLSYSNRENLITISWISF